MIDQFYRTFEDKYRGSRELILQRLEVYAPILRNAHNLQTGPTAMDLGCGRGEWLQLARDYGLSAFGIDTDEGMLSECERLGLQVSIEDAVSALRCTESSSVAVVSAFHLVEHIPFDKLRELVAESLRVLVPGGVLILETPNPENIIVGSSSFYLDPTHRRPLPPSLVSFVVEFAGFWRQSTMRLQEESHLRNGAAVALKDVLGGVSPDYAVIAQKSGPEDVTVHFDAAFADHHGVTLADLCVAYEDKVERQFVDKLGQLSGDSASRLEAMRNEMSALSGFVNSVESRIEIATKTAVASLDSKFSTELAVLDASFAEVRTHGQLIDQKLEQFDCLQSQLIASLAEVRAHEQLVDQRLEQLDCLQSRLFASEQENEGARLQLAAIRSSTSWRVTRPLRLVKDQLSASERTLKRWARPPLLRTMHFAHKTPLLRAISRSALHVLPVAVQRRLSGVWIADQEEAARQLTVAVHARDMPFVNVAVLDMQPIIPALGGGRLRLLGLYHGLGPGLSARYVGTYDWPGESFRQHHITQTLEEIDIPLTAEHHAAAAASAQRAGGRTVIDLVFHKQAHLSPDYVRAARQAVAWADIVIFSHPWIAPLIDDEALLDKTVVYDAHNVEAALRSTTLDQSIPYVHEVLEGVEEAERSAGDRADLVLACSADDASAFSARFGWRSSAMQVVPNGVFSRNIFPPSDEQRAAARQAVGAPRPQYACLAMFVGSNYGPNVDAGRYICDELAPRCPHIEFVVAGSVCASLHDAPANVRLAGLISDEEKLQWLQASDIAINPMQSGSGTNIKMFDFMSAGLCVVTTPTGARGIDASEGISVVELDAFPATIELLAADLPGLRRSGRSNREAAERKYSWETLSPTLGSLLLQAHLRKRGALIRSGEATRAPRRIAHFSTTGLRCGVGEYTRKLARELEKQGIDNLFMACDSAAEASSLDASVNSFNGWFYDNKDWSASRIHADALRNLLDWRADSILIQYHPAYYPTAQLLAFARTCMAAGIRVSVVVHQFSDIAQEDFRALNNSGIVLFSHSQIEIERATQLGVTLCQLSLATEAKVEQPKDIGLRDWQAEPPVIVTNGFLREHKGASRLIEAAPLIAAGLPGAKILIQCALYPSEDSERELRRCEQLVRELGLEDTVSIDTAFLEKEVVLERLSKADLAVLPYEESVEGGSASAADVLAVGLPLVVSKSTIFNGLRNVTVTTENDVQSLSRAVVETMSDAKRYRSLSQASLDYCALHSWGAVTGMVLAALEARGPEDQSD